MNVQSLHIYPVKSIAGVSLERATAAARGFVGDRRFMVIDETGNFLSQRTHPMLGHVRAEGSDRAWVLRRDGADALTVDDVLGEPVDTTVWSDNVVAHRVSDAADAWFSELLDEPVRFVTMPAEPVRATKDGDPVSFADGYPYLIAVEASLHALNDRIDGPPIPMAAFRPNIVVTGADAWAEDDWTRLTIGDAVFDIISPCERCRITTLDPDAPGRPRRDNEPLRTLATFRRADGGVIFAVNAVCRTAAVTVRRDAPVHSSM